jgi:hypothetical protein
LVFFVFHTMCSVLEIKQLQDIEREESKGKKTHYSKDMAWLIPLFYNIIFTRKKIFFIEKTAPFSQSVNLRDIAS